MPSSEEFRYSIGDSTNNRVSHKTFLNLKRGELSWEPVVKKVIEVLIGGRSRSKIIVVPIVHGTGSVVIDGRDVDACTAAVTADYSTAKATSEAGKGREANGNCWRIIT